MDTLPGVGLRPTWLMVIIGIASLFLGVFTDRLAIGQVTANLEARVRVLEERAVEDRASNEKFSEQMRIVSAQIDANALLLQRIADRQEEVRRLLRIER